MNKPIHTSIPGPEIYELAVEDHLSSQGVGFRGFGSRRVENLQPDSGEYELSMTAHLRAGKNEVLTLIECKCWNRKVERKDVQHLLDNVQALGAQEGMLYSLAGFENGAIEYAMHQGIALMMLVDFKVTHFNTPPRERFAIARPPVDVMVPLYSGWLVGINRRGKETYALVGNGRSETLRELLLGDR